MTAPSVVSLLPAATETLYALGVEPAAVSHECTYPPAAAERPRANSCVVDPDADSEAVNRAVEDHDTLYELDRDVLRAVDPDLVITQATCDVCAVDALAARDVIAGLAIDPAVLTLDAHTIGDMLDTVDAIGDAVHRGDRAAALRQDLEARIAAVKDAADRAVVDAGQPRTLVLDWLDPPMVAAHWVPGLVETAGGRYGLAEPGGRAIPHDLEAIAAFDPEVLVLAPCGLDIETTRGDLPLLAGTDAWRDIAAVRDDAVYAMDGNVLNCPSPRLVDALETLASLLHGDRVPGPTAAVEPLPPRPVTR